MPAFFLLFRVGRFILPLPWFLVWLLLLPLVPLSIAASPFFRRKGYGPLMRNAHRVWWTTTALHGLKIDINSNKGDRVYLSFI